MVAAITERRKEDRRAHLIEECPQADRIQAVSETLLDLKDSNKRVAIALETLAERGAQVDSHEKHLDTHDVQIDTAFAQIRGIDARVMNLEIKKGEWKGAKKAQEKEEVKAEKEKTEREKKYVWTVLEKIQLMTPILITVAIILQITEKYKVVGWLLKQIKEAWPF